MEIFVAAQPVDGSFPIYVERTLFGTKQCYHQVADAEALVIEDAVPVEAPESHLMYRCHIRCVHGLRVEAHTANDVIRSLAVGVPWTPVDIERLTAVEQAAIGFDVAPLGASSIVLCAAGAGAGP